MSANYSSLSYQERFHRRNHLGDGGKNRSTWYLCKKRKNTLQGSLNIRGTKKKTCKSQVSLPPDNIYSIHTETGWDLRPWPAVITPRPAAEYKEPIRDWKEVHACIVGMNDGQRDTKRPMSHFWRAESKNRSQERKQDITHALWTQHRQGSVHLRRTPLPDPWTGPCTRSM